MNRCLTLDSCAARIHMNQSHPIAMHSADPPGRPPGDLGDEVPRYSRREKGFKIKVIKRPKSGNGPTATGLFIKNGCLYTMFLLPLSRAATRYAATCYAMWVWVSNLRNLFICIAMHSTISIRRSPLGLGRSEITTTRRCRFGPESGPSRAHFLVGI